MQPFGKTDIIKHDCVNNRHMVAATVKVQYEGFIMSTMPNLNSQVALEG